MNREYRRKPYYSPLSGEETESKQKKVRKYFILIRY